MKAIELNVGDVVCDSLPFSLSGTSAMADNLRDRGVAAMAGYLPAINRDRLLYLLDCGVGFAPVTYAGAYRNGPWDELDKLTLLGIPNGTTVWLDMEGKQCFQHDPADLAKEVNAWCMAIKGAGYIPGLYVGVPQPLTSDELWKLKAERYWRGQGSIRDRHNVLAEPTGCGWCMTQMYPSQPIGDLLVDYNMVGQDYRGRVPTAVFA